SDRGKRRQGRQDPDLPSRQLRHRRCVRSDECGHRADHARSLFPADARPETGSGAKFDGAGGIRRPGRIQRERQVQEDRILGNRQDGRGSVPQVAIHKKRRQRLGRHDRALLRRPLGAPPQMDDPGLYGHAVPRATGAPPARLDVGPQDQEAMAKLAKGLDLVVDYGIFTVIAAPLFWLLKWLHGLIGNWGWAIIAMTIIIKSAFYPLNHASARSMAKMKVIAPKLKALQAQYADDKQQLQVKMMEMYKQEKINPLGGCL